jgi:hypothetical protein
MDQQPPITNERDDTFLKQHQVQYNGQGEVELECVFENSDFRYILVATMDGYSSETSNLLSRLSSIIKDERPQKVDELRSMWSSIINNSIKFDKTIQRMDTYLF